MRTGESLAMSGRSSRANAKVPQQRPSCVFCGSSGPLTEEHVFGDWLRKLGFTGEGLREWSIDGVSVQQKGGPFSKELKIACRRCNGVWMSGMEDSVKPLLVEMFKGNRVALNEAAQRDLSRWAFKTVIVSSHVDRQVGRIPAAHRRAFHRTDEPPFGAVVRIGSASVMTQQPGEHLAECSFRPRPVQVKFGDGRVVDVPAYTGRFRLLNVVFDVFASSSDEPDLYLRMDLASEVERALLQVWPVKHPTIWWPPAQSLDALGGLSGLEQGEQWSGLPTIVPFP